MTVQLELYPGYRTLINLLPVRATAGANFGITSMLSGFCELMDLDLFTVDTKTVIMNEDGGTENVNWAKIAILIILAKELKTIDECIVPRLPPEHHNPGSRE